MAAPDFARQGSQGHNLIKTRKLIFNLTFSGLCQPRTLLGRVVGATTRAQTRSARRPGGGWRIECSQGGTLTLIIYLLVVHCETIKYVF